MRRIPVEANRTVFDHLIATTTVGRAQPGIPMRLLPRSGIRSLLALLQLLRSVTQLASTNGLSAQDRKRLFVRLVQYLTSSTRRRDDADPDHPHAIGHRTWWQFIGGDRLSAAAQTELDTFLRILVAMDCSMVPRAIAGSFRGSLISKRSASSFDSDGC
jgi:hypothetical protein